MTGGFPCVTFSTAGRRAGVVDDLNGKLYLELCRVIREARPRYFVAENVRGMLSANGGNAVKLVLASFFRLGYRVSWQLVNMADHGVPQTRQRVLFVGVRVDEDRGAFRFPAPTHRVSSTSLPWLPPPVSLRDAVGDLGNPTFSMHGDSWRKTRRRQVASGYQNSQPRGADEPAHALAASDSMMVGVRNPDFHNSVRSADGPCVAVTASAAPELTVRNHVASDRPGYASHQITRRESRMGSPSATILSTEVDVPFRSADPGVRRMSVRECARVQSFPDWFEFVGSVADCYRQVGNAVPPLYARRLALALLEYDRRRKL